MRTLISRLDDEAHQVMDDDQPATPCAASGCCERVKYTTAASGSTMRTSIANSAVDACRRLIACSERPIARAMLPATQIDQGRDRAGLVGAVAVAPRGNSTPASRRDGGQSAPKTAMYLAALTTSSNYVLRIPRRWLVG